ncbi:MAG: metallophosphoesterase [Actinoplanes sp.]
MTPLVVAHLSDLHLGAHEPAAVAGLPDAVAACQPALTVVTGDSTMRARNREFRQVRELLDALPRPLLVVTGNHDLPLTHPDRLLRPYRRYRRWIDDELDPVCRIPGLTARGLPSMPRWRGKNGRVTGRQVALVGEVLGAAPPGDVRLLALHHPAVVRGRLRRALRDCGADLALAGHTHLPAVRPLAGGPLLVVAGTATSTRVRRDVPRSWTQLRIDQEAVEVRELRPDGPGSWEVGRVVRHRRG